MWYIPNMPTERKFGELPVNVRAVLAEMETHALENPRTRNVTRELGTFLYMASRFKRAKNVVEVGTSNGYSTVFLAQAVEENDGIVVTIEKDPEKLKGAMRNFQKAGLENRIVAAPGRAQDILPQLIQPIDMLFMDILPEEYLDCIRAIGGHLEKGAIVIGDNFLGHRDRNGHFVAGQGEGNDFINFAKESFASVSEVLGIGSGIVVCTV